MTKRSFSCGNVSLQSPRAIKHSEKGVQLQILDLPLQTCNSPPKFRECSKYLEFRVLLSGPVRYGGELHRIEEQDQREAVGQETLARPQRRAKEHFSGLRRPQHGGV